MALPFLLIFAGFQKLLTLQGGDLHSGERRLAATAIALGILAVGHFEAAEGVRILDLHFFDRVAAQLDVERLAADGIAGARHDVGRGDPAGDGHLDAGIGGLDGVESAQPRLNRTRHFVAVDIGRDRRSRPEADVRMRINEAGNDHCLGQVDDRRAARNGNGLLFARGDDFAVSDNQNSVVNRRRRYRVQSTDFEGGCLLVVRGCCFGI
jgi:hypothetical protein